MTFTASAKGWDSTELASTVNTMSDEATKVTIRMGPEVIQAMEDFMSDHGIENRSDFIRDAISGYIASQENGGAVETGGIFVRFSDTQMIALREIAQHGLSLDIEEFIRSCVLREIVPEDYRRKAYTDAFEKAFGDAVHK